MTDITNLDWFADKFEHCLHDLVMVSTPKKIIGEFRFVVSATKKIIAQSCYQYQGLHTEIPTAPHGATELVKELLEKVPYYPDPIFCYDICEDSDGNYWLLELTSFCSAGLYACDKRAVVQQVSELTLEQSTATINP